MKITKRTSTVSRTLPWRLLVIVLLVSEWSSKQYCFIRASADVGGSGGGVGGEMEDDDEDLPLNFDQPPPGVELPKAIGRVKVTPLTWAVTASSFMTTEDARLPLKSVYQDVSQTAPYVHWTCFKHKAAPDHKTKDRIECCQKVYELMEQEPHALCYIHFDGCDQRKKPESRTEWLHLCAEQISQVPINAFVSTTTAGAGTAQTVDEKKVPLIFQPRFTLLLAPPATMFTPKDQQIWRQYVWFSTTGVRGQWHFTAQSPLKPAIDIDTFLKVEEEESNMQFGTILETGVKGSSSSESEDDDDDDDNNERYLHHNLTVSFKPMESAPDDTVFVREENKTFTFKYSSDLRIMVFVPEGMLIPKKDLLGKCQTLGISCGLPSRCKVTSTIPLSKINSDVDRQEVLPLSLHLEAEVTDIPADNFKSPEATEAAFQCQLQWTTRLLMDDPEEHVLLASPTVYDGQLAAEMKGDAVVAGSITTQYQWKVNQTYPEILTTNLAAMAAAKGGGKGVYSDEL